MDINKLLQTILMVGADLPAYKALFDQVVDTFDKPTQDSLKARYEELMRASDEAHRRAQED